MISIDALRAKYPHLGFCLYAFAGQPVTLECIAADGSIFRFDGPTEEAAIRAGFADDSTPPAETPGPPTTNVFD